MDEVKEKLTTFETKIDNVNTYSTEEIEIGTFNDKKLYRRIIEATTNPNANEASMASVTIPNVEMCLIDKTHSYLYMDSAKQYIPLETCWGANGGIGVLAQVNDDVVTFPSQVATTAWCNKPAIITIEYTKTTD